MTKKQKTVLYRILVTAVLMILLHFVKSMYFPEAANAAGGSHAHAGGAGSGGLMLLMLYLVPYLVIGHDVLKKAVHGVVNRQPTDENFLMAVATIGAMALGEYTEGVAVMLFYQIGELFQSYAVGKSRRNISELMDICPDEAFIENENGEIESVDPDEVEIGTVIVVRPGEKIPIDGLVREGSSYLDTTALTGESVPRGVSEGMPVVSGCINLNGTLKVETTKEFGESTASKILDMVENTGARKSRSEHFISRFARIYTPAVCGLALLLAAGAPLLSFAVSGDAHLSQWIYRALTFLVISCPCALVISIPLTFFAGIGGASNAGVLVKGSVFLEELSKVRTIVFDKTGTLTEGVFEVTKILPAGGWDARDVRKAREAAADPDAEGPVAENSDATNAEDRLLELAALAEVYSIHPVSRSLTKAWEERNGGKHPDSGRVSDVHEESGHGVRALVDNLQVAAGNAAMMEALGVAYEKCELPGTVVYVAADGVYAGCILVSDRIKKTSAEAIRALGSLDVETVMLTGDRESAAELTAKELGISSYYAGLLPGDKVEKVEALIQSQAAGAKTAFAGDGINDAPVLSRADVGIAMGAFGSDAAIEAADVVLMDDDPLKCAKAIRIARKVMRIVYENIWFAIGVKVLCLILGALGLANMWAAIFADVGVMVIAVLNAIRALSVKNL